MSTPSGLAVTAVDVWTVAQTVWGEARGEGHAGHLAVAQVIRNRHTLHPRWRGRPLAAICQAPWQFGCWNANDPNFPKLGGLTLADPVFAQGLLASVQVLAGLAEGAVGPSTHYYAVGSPMPRWAQGETPYIILGAHAFYAHIA